MLPSSVTLSPPKPLGGILLYRTCYITSPHGKGVRDIFFRASIRPCFCRPSRYLLLNHWAEFYSTELATSLPLMVRVCESNIIFPCVRPSMRPCIRPSRYLLLNHWAEFYRLRYITSPHETLFFRASVRPCVRRPSHYLLLNHWAEFYRTCYIISPHGKGVRDNIFSVRPSVHSSVTLSPPKSLGEILPNLLHHFPSW